MNRSGHLLAIFSDLHTPYYPACESFPRLRRSAYSKIVGFWNYQNGTVQSPSSESATASTSGTKTSFALPLTSGGDISLHKELGRSRQGQCHGLRNSQCSENNRYHKKSQQVQQVHGTSASRTSKLSSRVGDSSIQPAVT